MTEADRPLVTVVTAFHNREALAESSIRSLLAQTWTPLEILAVDDGSTDGTGAALERCADPRLRVVRQANMGLTPTLNAAIRASRGVFVAIHGAGDLSLPDRIARQAALLIERPEVGVVGCWWRDDDPGARGEREWRTGAALPFREMALLSNPFGHGEVMYRRALFDAVGGYREFFRFAQDRDLWVRMSRLCEHAVVPAVLYRRRRTADGVSASAEKTIHQAALSAFAEHCGREVAAGRPDPLEALGPSAGLLRPRSAGVANRLARTAVRFLMAGRLEAGRRLAAAGRAEAVTPLTLAIGAVAAASRIDPLWRGAVAPTLGAGDRALARLGLGARAGGDGA